MNDCFYINAILITSTADLHFKTSERKSELVVANRVKWDGAHQMSGISSFRGHSNLFPSIVVSEFEDQRVQNVNFALLEMLSSLL